jgi:hypothetical protein
MFLCATIWQYIPNRTFFGITEAPPYVLQLAEVRPPQPETKSPAVTKPAPSASSQPAGNGDRTALVDTSRTK